jgi:hypothetical protein
MENKFKRPIALRCVSNGTDTIKLTWGSALRLLLLSPKRRDRVVRSMHEELLSGEFVKAFFYPLYRTVYYPSNKSGVGK